MVAGPWLAETLKGLRSPEGLARIDPGAALNATLAALPAGRSALALPHRETRPRGLPGRRHGAGQDYSGALVAARTQAPDGWPATAKPVGSPGFAAGELGIGDRALCAWVEGAYRPSVGPSGCRSQDGCAGAAAGRGPGDHQLRLAPPRAVDRGSRVATGRPRRGPGHQEPRRQADPAGEGAEGAGAICAHRHAHREPPRAISGPFSTSSTRDCWDRRRSSPTSSKALRNRPHNSYGPLRELVRPYILRR